MSSYSDRWPLIEDALKQIGVTHTERIRQTRDRFIQASSTGIHLLPDFTLHNVTHSDNIILLLATLQSTFDSTLNAREAELLATSSYLHDLGMFYSEKRWEETILPELKNRLRFCPTDSCDSPDRYDVRGKSVGAQIRLTHNLLSARWLLDAPLDTFGLDADNRGYIITICRGHRVTDLKAKGCTCYRTKAVEGEALRVGILASLLRLADALDFFSNRTPKPVFDQRALDLLSNPIALEHWMKHYFVSDPHVTKDDKSYSPVLTCNLNFTVPLKYINGVSYADFFGPLFAKHVQYLAESDLDSDKYPPDFLAFLGVSEMEATIVPNILAGFRELPTEVVSTIEDSATQDVVGFLEWLPNRASAITVVQERTHLLEDVTHQLVAPLSGIQASSELLLEHSDEWDKDRVMRELERVHSLARWTARLARNFAFTTSMPPRITLSFSAVDLSRILISCARDVQGIAGARGISLHVDMASVSQIPQIRVDTGLFTQAVTNLLDNAIKYSYKDTKVTVEAIPTLSDVRISITNYGIPIRGEDTDRIFSLYYRTREAMSMVPVGTGIGLAVARDVIRMHNGDLFVTPSVQDETIGAFKTVFTIVLPYL